MIAAMTGKAPLLLASFLFGVGATGLVITTAERAEWGPFQPQTGGPAAERVVLVDGGAPMTVPPLFELFPTLPQLEAQPPAMVEAQGEPAAPLAVLEPAAPAPAEPAGPAPHAAPVSVPITPARAVEIPVAEPPDVSAAGDTPVAPLPPPVIEDEDEDPPGDENDDGGTPVEPETPPPGDCPDANAKGDTPNGVSPSGCGGGDDLPGDEPPSSPALLAGKSGKEIPGKALGVSRNAQTAEDEDSDKTPGNQGKGNGAVKPANTPRLLSR